jgi:hypothetical protein
MKLYPRDVRKAIGVEVGDLLETKVEAGKSLRSGKRESSVEKSQNASRGNDRELFETIPKLKGC